MYVLTPPLSLRDLMRSSTTVDATGSSPAVGSSYMMSSSTISPSALTPLPSPSFVIALARATRFFMPPESSLGYLSSMPFRPTLAKLSDTLSMILPWLREECSYNRNPTFSPTVSESKRAPFWKTSPS
mmetsp:Transcript_5430/g.16457  ORF Transcript_5430/g.16457 Transcript_5430/m.16457 type:complete len:128 (-) Transcript_5430:592-975(-)